MAEKKKEVAWVKVPKRLLTMLKGEPLRVWLIIKGVPPGFAVTMQYLMSQTALKERQVRRILSELEDKGLLGTVSKRSKNGRTLYAYTAVFPDEQETCKVD